MNRFISIKDGVGINVDHITVVRHLSDDVWQISLTNGKHEYVKDSEVSSTSKDFLRSMIAGRYHTNA